VDHVSASPPIVDLDGRSRSREATALKEEVLRLHEVFRPRLVRYVASMGVSFGDAEDIVQETFLALFQHLVAGKPRTNLPGWIFRVAHRLALKRRVSYRDRPAETCDVASTPDANAPSPEDQVIFLQQQRRLRRIFLALPEMDRLCLQLRCEGLKYREIGGILNISLGSVYNSLERSLQRLR